MRRAPGLIVCMADEIIPYDKTAWYFHLWATTVYVFSLPFVVESMFHTVYVFIGNYGG